MPRFYFHIPNDVETFDDKGSDLSDLETARSEARRTARDLACESLKQGHLNLQHRIDIADRSGDVLDSIRFRDVVRIIG